MKVGLLTYHAAYNFGSVMQAFALQNKVASCGYEIEILNYRMTEQKKYYSRYRLKYGIKVFIKDVLQLPNHFNRGYRAKKYEDFIKSNMILSDEVSTYKDVLSYWRKYDLMISGSDQIWSLNSNELKHTGLKNMLPYLLEGFTSNKISYASSLGSMNEEQINTLIPSIKKFNFIALREKKWVEYIKRNVDINIYHVVDPTLLYRRSEWIDLLKLKEKKADFILYYSLQGIKDQKSRLQEIKRIAIGYGLKIRIVTPFVQLFDKSSIIENCSYYGPLDIAESILNARFVITDSYHGTVFSMNFRKNFVSLCKDGGSEYRKKEVLSEFGLLDRAIYRIKDIDKVLRSQIDYNVIDIGIEDARKNSFDYIKFALSSCQLLNQ